jgi:hypothetical protein
MSSCPEAVPVAEGLEVVEYYAPSSNRKIDAPANAQNGSDQSRTAETAYKLASEKQFPQSENSVNAVHEKTTGQPRGESKILGLKRKRFLAVVGSSCALVIIAALIGALAGVLVRNKHPSPEFISSTTSG